MTRAEKDRWGYTTADKNSRVVTAARFLPGILKNGQLIIQLPTEAVDYLLNEVRGEDQDEILKKVLDAVDGIIAQTIDEYANAYANTQPHNE